MNKYLHLLLSFGLLVSAVLDLSAKSNPEKGEPTKPVAKRAVVAVSTTKLTQLGTTQFTQALWL